MRPVKNSSHNALSRFYSTMSQKLRGHAQRFLIIHELTNYFAVITFLLIVFRLNAVILCWDLLSNLFTTAVQAAATQVKHSLFSMFCYRPNMSTSMTHEAWRLSPLHAHAIRGHTVCAVTITCSPFTSRNHSVLKLLISSSIMIACPTGNHGLQLDCRTSARW